MKPRYLRLHSDLHLEGWQGTSVAELAARFIPVDDRDAQTLLCLAGDISSKPEQLVAFIKVLQPRFLKVCFVPGNHEFYRHDMHDWSANLFEALRASVPGPSNLAFSTLDVRCEELEGVRLIFGTLWADGGKNPLERFDVQRGLVDFRLITKRSFKWTVADMAELNVKHARYIEHHLKKPFDGITVVMTHHMPSYSLCHPRFGTDLNGGFASNCDHLLMGDHAPDLWLHGHTHDQIDRTLGDTRVVCNPLGYHHEQESSDPHHAYQHRKFIDLEDVL